jgi:hypothetical protein
MISLARVAALVVCPLVLNGCVIIGGITGAITGLYDCTEQRIAQVGWAGAMWLPLAPFEGAYYGSQIGWYRDRKVFHGQPDLISVRASLQPCMAANAFRGSILNRPLSWSSE